ncbi:hypothetical protein ACFYW1_34605 [Streptomyces sp. NPDC002669]|uniref:hypothetical protein n=1 Tax=Streptomyces sp. NPDC002669 TaxID=3364658 RepID=UPI0036A2304A
MESGAAFPADGEVVEQGEGLLGGMAESARTWMLGLPLQEMTGRTLRLRSPSRQRSESYPLAASKASGRLRVT